MDFCSKRETNAQIENIAKFMAENDIEPIGWLFDYVKNDTVLELALSNFVVEQVNNLLALEDGMQQGAAAPAAPSFGNTMRQVGSNLWNAVKTSGQNIANWWNGPQAQFQNAVKALQSLSNTISNNQATAGMKTADGSLLTRWLGGVEKQLVQHANAIPTQQTQQAQTSWNQANMGPVATGNAAQPPGTMTQAGPPPVVNAA